MTEHYPWEATLDQRCRTDPGIDDPDRRAAARDIRNIGYHLAQMRKQRGMTQAEAAWADTRTCTASTIRTTSPASGSKAPSTEEQAAPVRRRA